MTAVATPSSLSLKAGEVRVLDHVLTEVLDHPEKFGATETEGDAQAARARAALIKTAGVLRRKLGLEVPKRRARRVAPPVPPEPVTVTPVAAVPAPAPAPEPVVVAPPVAAVPVVAPEPPPAPEPVVAPGPVAKKTQVHYLIVHTAKGRGKTLVEDEHPSFQDAWDARREALTNPEWRHDDVEIQVISGPSRDVLTKTHSRYFSVRPPRRGVSTP